MGNGSERQTGNEQCDNSECQPKTMALNTKPKQNMALNAGMTDVMALNAERR